MSRDIRFRAWDYVDKVMYHWHDYPDIIWEAIPLDAGDEWTERCEVMQFTGLTPPNGQDIYEGDILNTKAARWEVVFEKGAFMGKWLMGAGDPDLRHILWPMMEHAILLGNRYEHPELLTSPFAPEGSR